MTFSYVPDFTTTRDQIRFELGDTDSTDPLFTDEELAQVAAIEGGNLLRSLARACEVLANHASRTPDFEIGGKIKQTSSQVKKMWEDRAKSYRTRAARSSGGIWSGGHSIQEKLDSRQDPDVVQPAFTETMDTEPATEPSDFPDPRSWAPFL